MSTVFSAYTQQQYNAEKDFTVKIIDDGKSIEITKYVGTSKEVRIPPRIQNLPVTVIGAEAFKGGDWKKGADEKSIFVAGNQLVTVTIPNSVTHIGALAFMGNQLTNVIIPNSVTHIANGTFWTNQLTSVIIPNSVTHIEALAFAGNQLTSVTIPNSATYIGAMAFRENQLSSVTIPNSVTHIEGLAFARNQLTSVTVPNNVTNIGAMAFIENKLICVIIGTNVRLGEDYYVFDKEFQDFYRSNRSRAGTYNYKAGRWSFSFPDNPATSGSDNRVANTTWEALKDSRITISFGETSFSFTYLVWVGTAHTKDGWGKERIAGSYTMNGDSMTLNGNIPFLGSIEMTGALIGDSLTISGLQDGFEFHRVK